MLEIRTNTASNEHKNASVVFECRSVINVSLVQQLGTLMCASMHVCFGKFVYARTSAYSVQCLRGCLYCRNDGRRG